MSSTVYSAELKPDPRLRRLVAWTGVLLGAVGVPVILLLPLDLWVRWLACGLWVGSSVWEIRQLRRGWADCRAIRFSADGAIVLLGADGTWRPASRKSGGVLLGKVLWLRLQSSHGRVFGELLLGDARQSPDWRRLQVIWRHIGAGG